MKKNYLKYKGYLGSTEVSLEDGVMFGKIQFIRDIVTYEGTTVPELKEAFESAVDDYLADCEELGFKPNKSLSGTFNIRIGEARHQQLAEAAFKNDKTINDLICSLIDSGLDASNHKEVHLHFHSKKEIPFNTVGSTSKRLPKQPTAASEGRMSSEIPYSRMQ